MTTYDAAMRDRQESAPRSCSPTRNTTARRATGPPRARPCSAFALITQPERIHRSNLIGMGCDPMVFEEGTSWQTLGLSCKAERLPRRALLEYEWDNAHADKVRAMDALEGFGDHSATRLAERTPWRPNRGCEPVPYSLPAMTMERDAFLIDIASRRRRCVMLCALDGKWIVNPRLRCSDQQVLETDIRKRTARHHMVIAAPRTV